MPETVIKAIAPLARDHQSCSFQQRWGETLRLLQMADQSIPALRCIAQFKRFDRAVTEPSLLAQVLQSSLAFRALEVGAKPAAGHGQRLVELVPARELLLESLLLFDIKGFDRQRIAPGQLHHHVSEALALELHQELEAVAAGTAGEAVIKLLGR